MFTLNTATNELTCTDGRRGIFQDGDPVYADYLAWNVLDQENNLLSYNHEPSLAAAKAAALQVISDFAKQKRYQIAGTTDDAELAGFPNKLMIARAALAGTASSYELMAFQAEIAKRGLGETMQDFCAKVVANAGKFSVAVGYIDGIKRKAQDSVKAAATIEQVNAALGGALVEANAAFAAIMGG